MYPNEILFTDKFLATLKLMGYTSMPYKTQEYRNGVRAMKKYYELHANQLSEGIDDIELLFIRNGEKDFAEAIMAVNGHDISLNNPSLEKASIQMSETKADLTIEDKELNIPDTFMKGITQAFCDAAFADAL